MLRRNAQNTGLNVRKSLMLAAFAAAPVLTSPDWAQAQATYTWDSDAAAGLNPFDGAGTWDTTALNFWDSVGATNVAWVNNTTDTAVFGFAANGGATGIVTIGAPITLNKLTLDRSGYNFTGSGANALTFGGTTPTLQANTSGTLNTPITASSALTFNISPTSTVSLGSAAALITGDIIITGGGTFNFGTGTSGGSLTGSATLSGGTIALGNTKSIARPLIVSASTTNGLVVPGGANNNATYTGTFSGSGAINIGAFQTNSFLTMNQNSPLFTGSFNFIESGGIIRFQNASVGAAAATFNLGSQMRIASNGQAAPTIYMGALTGSNTAAIAGSNGSTAGTTTYEIGGANVDCVFDGYIRDGSGEATLNTVSTTRKAAVRKVGTAKLTLGGATPLAMAYSGPTTINGGTIALTNAAVTAKTPLISINNGAHFDVSALGTYTIPSGQTINGSNGNIWGNITDGSGSVIDPAGVASAGTITVNGGLTLNGGLVRMDIGQAGIVGSGTNDLITVNGDLTLPAAPGTGTISVSVLGSGAVGVYRLLDYTGNLVSGDIANLNFLAATRGSMTLTINTTEKHIDAEILSTGSAGTVRWNTGAGNWDVNTSANWFNTTTLVTDKFFQGDAVTFDDNAAGGAVSVSAAVYPSSVLVNSNTANYSFTGSGTIVGQTSATKLVKQGTSNLTISNQNTYAGGTEIEAGTVTISNASALGTGTITLKGGALAFNTGSMIFNNPIAVTANSTLNKSSGDSAIFGALSGSAKLSIVSTIGVFSINNNLSAFTGTIDLSGTTGTFRWHQGGAAAAAFFDFGDAVVPMISRNAGTWDMGALAGTNASATIKGATSDPGVVTYRVGARGDSTVFAGQILNGTAGGTNTVHLEKVGTGTLTLTGSSNYTGNTTIIGGTLVVQGVNATMPVMFNAGAILNGGLLVMDYAGSTSPKPTLVDDGTEGIIVNAPGGFQAGRLRTSLAVDSTKAIGWLDDTVSIFKARYTYRGDVDLNGVVNSLDFAALALTYGTAPGAIWGQGDSNYDGKVNTEDFNYLAGNFGLPAMGGATLGASLGAVVPEPTIGVGLLSAGLLLRRRRNR